jgi:hypothetical protein
VKVLFGSGRSETVSASLDLERGFVGGGENTGPGGVLDVEERTDSRSCKEDLLLPRELEE